MNNNFIKVSPKSFSGYNFSLMQMFGKGPKFTVKCGNCESTFRDRIEMVDRPTLKCPFCNALNVLDLRVTRR